MNRRKRRKRRWLQTGIVLVVAIAGILTVRSLLRGSSTAALKGSAKSQTSSNKVVPLITKGAGTKAGTKAGSKTGSQTGSQTGSATVKTARKKPVPQHALLSVAAQDQNPQLPNGCEVTSLSMLLGAIGHPVSKMTLANEAPKAPVSVTWKNGAKGLPKNWRYDIQEWGNPNKGFVGNMTHQPGYGIYHGPLTQLLNQILPGNALDLTGKPVTRILNKVAHGIPVVMWVNTTFKPLPASDWVTWNNPSGPVKATFFEHAVLLVGYNSHTLYINNPINGKKGEAVNRSQFLAAWKQMGSQALTVKSANRT